MKNILSLFYRTKRDIEDEKEAKIKIYRSRNSNQFFLEDGYELRTVKTIRKSHEINDEIMVMESFHKTESLGKRKLEDFEIPSFLIEKEKEKNFDISFYFFKKEKIIRNHSYLIRKKYTIQKNRFWQNQNHINEKSLYEKTVKIKRDDNKDFLSFKLKIFHDNLSFQEIEKNGITTQLPFIIINKIILNILNPNIVIIKTKIMNYSIMFKNDDKAKKIFLIIYENFKNSQNKHFHFVIDGEIKKSNVEKINEFMTLKDLKLTTIFGNKILRKVFFDMLFKVTKNNEEIEVISIAYKFLQICDNKNDVKRLKPMLLFFVQKCIIKLEALVKNNSNDYISQSIIGNIIESTARNNIERRTGYLLKNLEFIEKKRNKLSLSPFNEDEENTFEPLNSKEQNDFLNDERINKEEIENKSYQDIISNPVLNHIRKNHNKFDGGFFKNLKGEDFDEKKLEIFFEDNKIITNSFLYNYIKLEIQNYLFKHFSKSEFISFLLKSKSGITK